MITNITDTTTHLTDTLRKDTVMGENGAMGGMGPADFAAVMRGNNGYYNDGFGGGGYGVFWIVILFFAMMWGGNGWGNNGFQNAIGYENLATSNEVQRGFDNQNSLANEREILSSINANSMQGIQNANQNTQYMTSMLNDKYNELQRDIAGVGMMQQQAMANQNDCCCSTKMLIQDNTAAINYGIAQNRYDAALNTANLNAGMAQNRYEAALNTAAINSNLAENKYEAAMNTASIVQAIQQDGSATRQLMQDNKIEELQEKVQNLNLQVQLAGVARVPMYATYNAGPYPFCNCPQNNCGW